MLVELLLFLTLGIVFGVIFGLIPGVHPNTIVLLIPLFLSLDINPLNLITFIVAVGITNSIIDTIPSILLGVPDAGNELSILPGHKMLLAGRGYDAIKLTSIGSIYSLILVFLLLPLLILFLPAAFSWMKSYIYLILIFIVAVMVFTEKKKTLTLFVFFMAGSIGLLAGKLPVNNTLTLFPIFAGFFGLSQLLLQKK